jgi:hypothetical protein
MTMAKRLLLGAAMALAAGMAQAQEGAWNVQFTDVMGRITYGWSPEPPPPPPFEPANLSAFVRGEDRNGDGWIDETEVSELRFGHDNIAGDYANCGASLGVNDFCALEHFRFAPDGPLGPTFEMKAHWSQGSGYDLQETLLDIGTENQNYRFQVYRQLFGYYYWTEDTQLLVSAVPEPAHGAMLLAGLALLGLRRRQARTG